MTDFTTLLNRGHKRYVDKYLKRRKFGKCEGCDKPALLLEYCDPFDPDIKTHLCERCYVDLLDQEE